MATPSRRPARRATAQDVADLAGVSRSSVSLVMNGRAAGNISAVKQQAVIEAARALAYRPNALALSLRSQRSWTLGVLTWRGAHGCPGDMLQTTWRNAAAAGYLSILAEVPDGLDPDHRASTALLDRRVDGLLVIAPVLTTFRLPDPLAGLSTVMVNALDADNHVTTIVPDELGGAACATQILLDHGHTRIALLSDEAETEQAHERRAGVEQAMSAVGLSPQHAYGPDAGIRQGFALAEQVLAGDDPPTALVCSRERLALGALIAARAAGLDVPSDLSVISLDDGEQLSADAVPELATIHRPDQAMAEQAVALLLHDINTSGEHEVRRLTFVCPAKLGGSVAAVPGH